MLPGPNESRQLSSKLCEAGALYLEAPVLGSQPGGGPYATSPSTCLESSCAEMASSRMHLQLCLLRTCPCPAASSSTPHRLLPCRGQQWHTVDHGWLRGPS